MALFQDYESTRQELIKEIETFKEFEASDKNVKEVMDIARGILINPKDMYVGDILASKGSKLVAYYGNMLTLGNQAWAEYKVAEVAFKGIRDALMLALKVDKPTITEAKASAARDTAMFEVDVIKREKRYRDYDAVARSCDKMVTWVQTLLRKLEAERVQANMQGRGK